MPSNSKSGIGEAEIGQKDYLAAVREFNTALGIAAELVVLIDPALQY
jgi:hypothetical protein